MNSRLIKAFLIGGLLTVAARLLIDGLAGGGLATCAAVSAVVVLYVFYDRDQNIDRDRAGDNLYYLGFLFTLLALAYVVIRLFAFPPETGADSASKINEVIAQFGIALCSTIAGILARILMQNRNSEHRKGEIPGSPPFHSEDLLELRRTISEVTDSFSYLVRATQSQAENTMSRSRELLERLDEHMGEMSQRGHSQAMDSLEEIRIEWKEAAGHLKEDIQRTFETAHQSVESSTNQVKEKWRSVGEEVNALSYRAASRVHEISDSLQPLTTGLATVQNTLNEFDRGLSEAHRRLLVVAEAAEKHAVAGEAILRDARQKAEETRQVVGDAANQVHRAEKVADEAEEVLSSIRPLLDNLAELTRQVATASESMSVTSNRIVDFSRGTGEFGDSVRELAEESKRAATDVHRARETLVDVIKDTTKSFGRPR